MTRKGIAAGSIPWQGTDWVARIVWIATDGTWHLGLAFLAEGDYGFLEDGREWRSAKKDFP